MLKLSEREKEIYKKARSAVSAEILTDCSLLRLTGEDHLTFLQGQTTNDILSLKDGQGQPTAILDPKAKVRALAMVYRCKECVYMVLPSVVAAEVVEHLNKYIVMDDAEIEVLNYEFLYVSGPSSRKFLEEFFGTELRPRDEYEHQQLSWSERAIPLALQNLHGETGFLFFIKNATDFYKELNQFKELPLLTESVQEVMRIEAGTLKFGSDLDTTTLFPETNLQTEYVSYTKGCFVGQEIVARVKYRGSVNRAMMGLVFDDQCPKEPQEFSVRGQKAGVITSLCFSEYKGKAVALAYIGRNFRTPGMRVNVETEEGTFKCEVTYLPFYQRVSEIEEAEEIYHKALDIFSESSDDQDELVEPMLREAIRKNPKMADAYETLGVLLSRHERFDEAIELMKKLKEMSPDTVMAYSNLSLFYMKKGMIQEAEEEKAAATAASFKLAAKERKDRIEAEKLQKAKEEEAKRRLDMFMQVLEIDPEDLIANFGMGKALVESGRNEEAIKYLQKCLDVKKDYTVAYLQLGLAYKNSGNQAQAKEVFKSGIDCAIKLGDLMPKNEMQRHLEELK